VILKDVGPDVSVMSVREASARCRKFARARADRGCEASHRARSRRSKPWWPWHPLTRAAQQPVTPGAIEEYQIEIMATANMFRRGHRICLDITSLDLPTGVAGATNAEYVPYHVCSSKTVLHRIYHDRTRPSHLLLPVIPE
jgi:predicted acyl esterase